MRIQHHGKMLMDPCPGGSVSARGCSPSPAGCQVDLEVGFTPILFPSALIGLSILTAMKSELKSYQVCWWLTRNRYILPSLNCFEFGMLQGPKQMKILCTSACPWVTALTAGEVVGHHISSLNYRSFLVWSLELSLLAGENATWSNASDVPKGNDSNSTLCLDIKGEDLLHNKCPNLVPEASISDDWVSNLIYHWLYKPRNHIKPIVFFPSNVMFSSQSLDSRDLPCFAMPESLCSI